MLSMCATQATTAGITVIVDSRWPGAVQSLLDVLGAESVYAVGGPTVEKLIWYPIDGIPTLLADVPETIDMLCLRADVAATLSQLESRLKLGATVTVPEACIEECHSWLREHHREWYLLSRTTKNVSYAIMLAD